MALYMPDWATKAALTEQEYLTALGSGVPGDQAGLESILGPLPPGYFYENNGYTRMATDAMVNGGSKYGYGDINKYDVYADNGNIRYDGGKWTENTDPLTRVGYMMPGNEFTPGGWVSTEQSRLEARPFAQVGADWTHEDILNYLANTPDFYQKYKGINWRPAGYENWEGRTYSQDFPTGSYYGWKPTEVSGGIFGTSFLDPAKMSEWIEPINKYVGPLVLPTVMAIGGGMVGGGLAGAALAGSGLGAAVGTTASGAITGAAQGLGASTFNTINQIDQGNTGGALLGALGSAVTGGIGGYMNAGAAPLINAGSDYTSLGSNVFNNPTFTVDPSLIPSTLATPDLGSAYSTYLASLPENATSIFNVPSFTPDPTLATSSLLNPSTLGTGAAEPVYNNVFNQPTFTADPGLAPDAPQFNVNPELQAYSDSLPALDPNYKPSSPLEDMASDVLGKFGKGLLSRGANAAQNMPKFQVNFTPLSAQAFGNTGNSWATDAAGKVVSGNGTFSDTPFKGSFLMGAKDDQNLTQYLADYLPLNASKKMKDFSSFLA